MSTLADDHASDSADVFARVFEEHQVHVGVALVEFLQGLLKFLAQLGHFVYVVLGQFVVEEGREGQQFGVLLVEVLVDASVLDVLLDQLSSHFQVSCHVFVAHESVSVDTFGLVHPKFGEFLGLLEVVQFGLEHALEHTRQVADVEFLVEVGGRLLELVADFLVQHECSFAHDFGFVTHILVEGLEVVGGERLLDLHERLVLRQLDHQALEVALQTGVHEEAARSGVHGGNLHGVADGLQLDLLAVLPVVVVDALSNQRDCRLGVLGVALRHVQVVHELDQGDVASDGLEGFALLLQRAFELGLQAQGVRLVVEVDGLEVEVFGVQVLQHSFYQLRLSGSSGAHYQRWLVYFDQLLDEVRVRSSFRGFDDHTRDGLFGRVKWSVLQTLGPLLELVVVGDKVVEHRSRSLDGPLVFSGEEFAEGLFVVFSFEERH